MKFHNYHHATTESKNKCFEAASYATHKVFSCRKQVFKDFTPLKLEKITSYEQNLNIPQIMCFSPHNAWTGLSAKIEGLLQTADS